MADGKRKSFGSDFRHFFLRGLAVLLPSVLTLWIVVQAYRFVDGNIAEPINSGIRSVVLQAAPRIVSEERLPSWFGVRQEQIEQLRKQRADQALRALSSAQLASQVRARNLREWWNDHWYTRSIGLVVAIVLIYLAGRLVGGFIGRRVYTRLERFITRIPVFKQVYPYVKQVVDFLFGEQQIKFNRVVLVEYPSKGIWTIGLATGASLSAIRSVTDSENISVFIPSSPTPFTGYTITVPKRDAIDLPISIDEAIRFVVSGGVLVPERDQPASLTAATRSTPAPAVEDQPEPPVAGAAGPKDESSADARRGSGEAAADAIRKQIRKTDAPSRKRA